MPFPALKATCIAGWLRPALLAALVAPWLSISASPPLPMAAEDVHLGVTTCAGSNCHGATRGYDNSPVEQNEYFLWEREDRHAQAYRTLLTEQSRRIAKNLGIGPAHEAEACLVCHTDYVAPDKRGTRFQLSDGVGCEACHGGSERWLGPHVSGRNTHADNLALGLYPTEDPAERARLCLGCHQGDADHPMDHAIMGAGHPRLVFELDTFTAIEPAHYVADADYRERKPEAAGLVWAEGQIASAARYLDALDTDALDPGAGGGLLPELTLFDCNACHHPTDSTRWEPGMSGPGAPGGLRLHDAQLELVGVILSVLDPALAQRWSARTTDLQASVADGADAIRTQARTMQRELANPVRQRLDGLNVTAPLVSGLMTAVIDHGLSPAGADFTKAEQGAMALGALLAATPRYSLDAGTPARAALDDVYAAVDDPARYDPAAYRAALRDLRGLVTG